MVETSDLEAYITTTFTKITDEYNRPLNIGVAAPTLLDVIKGNTEQYANHVKKIINLFFVCVCSQLCFFFYK